MCVVVRTISTICVRLTKYIGAASSKKSDDKGIEKEVASVTCEKHQGAEGGGLYHQIIIVVVLTASSCKAQQLRRRLRTNWKKVTLYAMRTVVHIVVVADYFVSSLRSQKREYKAWRD